MIAGLQVGGRRHFIIQQPHSPKALALLDAGAGMLVNSLSAPEESRESWGERTNHPCPSCDLRSFRQTKASENASEQPAQARAMTSLKEVML